FFFFQAEDGIRFFHVTGVQTCALPILPSNWPLGCSGNDIQKPFESEPAATLSRKMLSGLVIQKLATVLSEGSSTSLEAWPFALTAWRSSKFAISPAAGRAVGTQALVGWHLVWIARFFTNWLPVSMPSSRKKQWPTLL